MTILASCQVGPFGQATPTPSASPTPLANTGIPASDPDGPRKVAERLFPDGGKACGKPSADVSLWDYTGCPATTILIARLNKHPIPYAEQLCRCAKPYGTRVFVTTLTTDGAVVRANLGIDATTQMLDIAIDKSSGSWAAADVTCASRGTSTSIFSDAPTLCYAPGGS
ncbi:MAG: hypothetical protein WAT58_10950 [Candidatus Dormiibacterota bacterium]